MCFLPRLKIVYSIFYVLLLLFDFSRLNNITATVFIVWFVIMLFCFNKMFFLCSASATKLVSRFYHSLKIWLYFVSLMNMLHYSRTSIERNIIMLLFLFHSLLLCTPSNIFFLLFCCLCTAQKIDFKLNKSIVSLAMHAFMSNAMCNDPKAKKKKI